MKELFDNEEEFGSQCNAVYNTLIEAGKKYCKETGNSSADEYACYEWMEETPKTSFTVEFVEMLNELGYKIIKNEI
jgi:hypothetical protein